jgi:hypothetical protein
MNYLSPVARLVLTFLAAALAALAAIDPVGIPEWAQAIIAAAAAGFAGIGILPPSYTHPSAQVTTTKPRP